MTPFVPQRQQQLQRLAAELDMEYQETDPWGMVRQLADFRLFSRGFRSRVRHVLRQQEDLHAYDLRLFDYRYVVWRGKHTRAVEQTALFLQSQQLGLPEFRLQPETILHKLGELLGATDIDFEAYPEFSRQYRLTSSDETYVRHHFNDQVLRFFSVQTGWTLEGLGYYLVMYKKGKVLPGKEVRDLYAKGLELYRLFGGGPSAVPSPKRR